MSSEEAGRRLAEGLWAAGGTGLRRREFCLPGCDRLDGHDGRDAGACVRDDGTVLMPGDD
jgi:hypothetical protein